MSLHAPPPTCSKEERKIQMYMNPQPVGCTSSHNCGIVIAVKLRQLASQIWLQYMNRYVANVLLHFVWQRRK